MEVAGDGLSFGGTGYAETGSLGHENRVETGARTQSRVGGSASQVERNNYVRARAQGGTGGEPLAEEVPLLELPLSMRGRCSVERCATEPNHPFRTKCFSLAVDHV